MTGPPPAADETVVHATCLVWGETGLLLRGPSGAGKSSLARNLVESGIAEGRFARLVADDRVRLRARHGRLLASPVAPLAGRLEVRGVGIVAVPYEPCCVVRLVVDLAIGPAARLPEGPATATLNGVALPRLELDRRDASGVLLWRLRGNGDTGVTER